jgi:hypothetical protein
MEPHSLCDSNNANSLKQELAQLAARHIAQEGLSYQEAKRKAAKQSGIAERNTAMPPNELIESALREYLADYMPEHVAELNRLRHLAYAWLSRLETMALDGTDNLLALVVGAIANGTANEHSPVHIHVFTDEFKHLEIALLNANVVLEHTEKKVDGLFYPVLVAQDAGVPIVLTVLPRAHYVAPKAASALVVWEYPQALNLLQLRTLLALNA